jgi:hypothetical protein
MAVSIKKGTSPSEKMAGMSTYGKHLGGEPMKYQQVVGQVTAQKKVSGQVMQEGASQEVVHPGLASGQGLCKVGVAGSRTLNLGNFESVKISVYLEMPCPPSEVESTYDFVTDWIGKKLSEAVKTQKE